MKKFSQIAVAVCAALTLLACGSVANAQGVAYLRADFEPWGFTSNVDNMNDVFGAGNWTDAHFSSVNTNALFSKQNCFIFIEGGDGTEPDFASYYSANLPAIQSWVAGGGSLFVNAAQWYNNLDYGFGGVTNNIGYYSSNGAAATAHPIFTDLGYGAPGTSWTGNFFSHGIITGSGGVVLITQDNGAALVEDTYGLGHVMFGNMTSTPWQSPYFQANALRENILLYGSQQANCVPEPGVVAFGIFASGSVLGLIARKRKA